MNINRIAKHLAIEAQLEPYMASSAAELLLSYLKKYARIYYFSRIHSGQNGVTFGIGDGVYSIFFEQEEPLISKVNIMGNGSVEINDCISAAWKDQTFKTEEDLDNAISTWLDALTEAEDIEEKTAKRKAFDLPVGIGKNDVIGYKSGTFTKKNETSEKPEIDKKVWIIVYQKNDRIEANVKWQVWDAKKGRSEKTDSRVFGNKDDSTIAKKINEWSDAIFEQAGVTARRGWNTVLSDYVGKRSSLLKLISIKNQPVKKEEE
jgi:hypothetical protein